MWRSGSEGNGHTNARGVGEGDGTGTGVGVETTTGVGVLDPQAERKGKRAIRATPRDAISFIEWVLLTAARPRRREACGASRASYRTSSRQVRTGKRAEASIDATSTANGDGPRPTSR